MIGAQVGIQICSPAFLYSSLCLSFVIGTVRLTIPYTRSSQTLVCILPQLAQARINMVSDDLPMYKDRSTVMPKGHISFSFLFFKLNDKHTKLVTCVDAVGVI